ncbi:MAG: preprotein translocase subunit SecG [Xanthomonadaceae bacterium]|nr:preprotein translocase subunit SecG [Xanthomonadaceae bacterium]
MFTTLIVFQVVVAIGLIAIVLVQRGAGATMGAAFGSGASGTVFGSRGAGNFLTRSTGWLAAGFFGISLTMAVLASGVAEQSSVGDSSVTDRAIEAQQAQDEPADAIDSVIDNLDRNSGDDAGQADTGDEAGPGQSEQADASAAEGEQDEPFPEPPV